MKAFLLASLACLFMFGAGLWIGYVNGDADATMRDAHKTRELTAAWVAATRH